MQFFSLSSTIALSERSDSKDEIEHHTLSRRYDRDETKWPLMLDELKYTLPTALASCLHLSRGVHNHSIDLLLTMGERERRLPKELSVVSCWK
jgi:hypothetical protein